MKKIACVIATYNRKDLLIRCLDAIDNQTYKPIVVYIVDNASTDATMASVERWSGCNRIKNNIHYKYILNSRNEGGAGAFYLGMKTAMEDSEYDGIWVMDDDGAPEPTCLEKLVPYLDNHDNIAPLCLPYGMDDRLSFNCNGETDLNLVLKTSAHNGVIKGYSAPFNAILYSTKLIKKIGYPKKEMFIWGDEINYTQRSIAVGAIPITVIAAIHRHPQDRMNCKTFCGIHVVQIEQRWKAFFYYRNTVYNYVRKYSLWGRVKYQIGQYIYLILSKQSLKWIQTFYEAYSDGFVGDFSRTEQYRNLIR